MRLRLFPGLFLLILILLPACSAAPFVEIVSSPGFFYLTLPPESDLNLVLMDSPNAAPRKNMPLNPPTDCSFYALRPAPLGRWVAVEWECAFGPTVELFDTVTGESHFALSEPTIDSRFLAWQPDGRSFYLKIGTLSVPQTLHVDVATGKATELSISPFAYDMTVVPDGNRIYFALSKGIGFGSEAWLAGPDGQNPSQLAVDAQNIIALAQYSPDGSQIAFIKIPDDQNSTPPGELWVMDSSGFHARKLADADAGHGFAPAWSPDGNRLAFVGMAQPDGLDISIYDISRSFRSVVYRLQSTATLTQPGWSPDGTLVTFSAAGTSPVPTQGDTMELWLYEISSGKSYKLRTGACCAGWIR